MYRGAVVATLLLAILVGQQARADARADVRGDAGEIFALLDCRPGYKWSFAFPRALRPTEAVQRNENRTSRSQSATFTSTQSQTFSKQISGGVETEAGGNFAFVKASIKLKFGIDVLRAKTAGINNAQTIIIGPHRAAIGAYGVYTRRFEGYFVRRARSGEGGLRNKRCGSLRAVRVSATMPLDEVGWVIRTAALR